MAVEASSHLIAIAYRYFLAVAERGSVRAAARSLNVAASAISRQLARLEHELGQPLFDRHGRLLELTPAGEVLLRDLRTARAFHEDTLDHLAALRGLARGRVRLATVESLSVAVLPDILLAFAARFPGIGVQVEVAPSDRVTELVRDQHADLGFTFNPRSLKGLDVVMDRAVPLGAVMSPDHALAGRPRLTLAECLAYPVAWPAAGLSLRAVLESVPASRNVEPQFECNSLRLMAALARRGSCIAFQTPIGIEQELAARELVWRPLVDRRLPADRLMVVRRPGRRERPAADAFLAHALKRLPKAGNVRK
jgi:DNA-binding transcriptional LysR family regulator